MNLKLLEVRHGSKRCILGKKRSFSLFVKRFRKVDQSSLEKITF